MMKEKENTPKRATAQLAAEYTELIERHEDYDFSLTYDERDKIEKRLSELHNGYDWDNYMFTDPATGKKGVKDITGRILVPALYDGFSFMGSYQLGHDLPKAAIKGGKYGFVAGDGSGKELTGFVYNSLEWDPATCFFKATWGNEGEHAGLVTPYGLVVKP